jgi:hypothetical protein
MFNDIWPGGRKNLFKISGGIELILERTVLCTTLTNRFELKQEVNKKRFIRCSRKAGYVVPILIFDVYKIRFK